MLLHTIARETRITQEEKNNTHCKHAYFSNCNCILGFWEKMSQRKQKENYSGKSLERHCVALHRTEQYRVESRRDEALSRKVVEFVIWGKAER
jgi:hypothetical protein